MHVMSLPQAAPKTYGSAGLFLVPRREPMRLSLVERAAGGEKAGLAVRRRVLFAVVAAPLALVCLLLMGHV